jgi:hypothetical protein
MILWPFGLHIVLAVALAAAMLAILFVLSSRPDFRRSSPVLAPKNTNITRYRRWSEALPAIQRILSPAGFPGVVRCHGSVRVQRRSHTRS